MRLLSIFTVGLLAQIGTTPLHVPPTAVWTITGSAVTLTPLAEMPPGPPGPAGPRGLSGKIESCIIPAGGTPKMGIELVDDNNSPTGQCIFITKAFSPLATTAKLIIEQPTVCGEPLSTDGCIDSGKKVLAPIIMWETK